MSTNEQELRREAIRRRLSGERRIDICRDLGYSPRWFDKWWSAFKCDPHMDFADRSRAPLARPTTPPLEIEQLVVELRQRMESADYGLIGARAMWGQLIELKVRPLPSLPTIQRILARHSLTHPLGAATEAAYYPWLPVWEINAVQATDIITKHIRGGTEVQNFHTIDLFSHAVCLSQYTDKSSATSCAHLLKAWEKLGIPCIHQFDNEGAFCGGHTHPRVMGRIVRLCLWCGVEPFFIPVSEPDCNCEIETFHSLWGQGFWKRQTFSDIAQVSRRSPGFLHWYHHKYRPPSLGGKTPAQMRSGQNVPKLTREVCRAIPDYHAAPLPVTAGRFHIMRKVDSAGYVAFLNERWLVGTKWIGEYVRATINTAQQTLTLSHKASDEAKWKLIKTRVFRIKESVHDLLPQFKRNCARCRDYLPG
jgi:putative transposase